MDTAKRDMSFTYGGRTFDVRAYHDGDHFGHPDWYASILEGRIILHHKLEATTGPADCFAAAIRYLTEQVDSQPNKVPKSDPAPVPSLTPASPNQDVWEEDGGAITSNGNSSPRQRSPQG